MPAPSTGPVEKVPFDLSKLARAGEMQNDYWIVTDYHYFRHGTLESAVAERDRLAHNEPKKGYRIYHAKRCLPKSKSGEIITALVSALKGVVAVADRKTDEFDAARAAISLAESRP